MRKAPPRPNVRPTAYQRERGFCICAQSFDFAQDWPGVRRSFLRGNCLMVGQAVSLSYDEDRQAAPFLVLCLDDAPTSPAEEASPPYCRHVNEKMWDNTTRKPILLRLRVLSGLFLLREAQRALFSLLLNEPPRSTRSLRPAPATMLRAYFNRLSLILRKALPKIFKATR